MSSISVIVATYNGTRQLESCINSIIDDRDENLEVVIADDGSSNPETLTTINRLKSNGFTTIKHAVQKDLGFRLARSRNNAVSISDGEVLLFLDHDILLPKGFFAELRKCMKTGWFAAGRRVKLDEETTEKLISGDLKPNYVFSFPFALEAIAKQLEGWRYLFPTRNRSPGKSPQPFRGMSGFCIAVHKKNFLEIDGFDASFQGYGVEDWDFLARLNNKGVMGGFLPSRATVAHLWHNEPEPDFNSPAYKKLETVEREKIYLPKIGYSKLKHEA